MSSRVFWGALLISLGALFLLSNFGVLPWGVWGTLLQAWPLLLVLFGASILLRPMGRLGALITALVVVVGLGGVVAYSYAYSPSGWRYAAHDGYSLGTLPLDQSLDSATETVYVNLDFGAGTVNLDGAAAAGKLAEGSLGYFAKQPSVLYTGGAAARLQVSMASGPWTPVPGYRSPTWTIHLNSKPVYELDLDTGACATHLDLSALKVSTVNLSTGASDSTITFGDSGLDARANLDFGAASVKVRVPRSVGVRVRLSTGLVGTNLSRAGLAKVGSDWVSPDYEAKASHLDITVDAGASSFNLEWTQ